MIKTMIKASHYSVKAQFSEGGTLVGECVIRNRNSTIQQACEEFANERGGGSIIFTCPKYAVVLLPTQLCEEVTVWLK